VQVSSSAYRLDPLHPNDSPIAKLLEGLLVDCIKRQGQALHISPEGIDDPVVRIQLGNEWSDVMFVPALMYAALLQRLRVVAGIDLIRRTPVQRGAVRVIFDNGAVVDIAVSIQATDGRAEEAFVRFQPSGEKQPPS
jgi:type II secretory ATPase GspE/PulE/Tfp pilus assembly ATPase PilB-like protein